METMNKYKQERLALENAFARRMLLDFNIKEVTTQRQAKMVQENLNFLYLLSMVSTIGTRNGK